MKLVLRLLLITASATSCGLFAVDPTFHLKNNNKDSIQIDIMQNNKSLTGLQRVAKGSEFPFQLDISKPTTLEIHYCPTPDYCKTNLPIKMIAKIKAGKTIYAKFDGKTIEPQKGDILGKTTSGYSTKNNIGKGDITVEGGGTKKSELGIGGKRDPQQIENEAWSYFPVTEQDRLMANTLPNEFWTKVQKLDYKAIISLPFDQTYSPILQEAVKKFDAKMAELKKIVDPEVRDKAQRIAITALEKNTAFIKGLVAQREAQKEAQKPAKPTAPKPTTQPAQAQPATPEPITQPAQAQPQQKPARSAADITREAWQVAFRGLYRTLWLSKEHQERDTVGKFYRVDFNDKDVVWVAEQILGVSAGTPDRKLSGAYNDKLASFESLKKTDPAVYEEIENILNRAFDILSGPLKG